MIKLVVEAKKAFLGTIGALLIVHKSFNNLA